MDGIYTFKNRTVNALKVKAENVIEIYNFLGGPPVVETVARMGSDRGAKLKNGRVIRFDLGDWLVVDEQTSAIAVESNNDFTENYRKLEEN